ncbi:GGDEF domain-containing protein [Salinispirillum marinum]|uniref:diguanylate cyclase n=2 Tax=Saccharospirillaceae TaxID=255527 RepID=A0ABV8BE69_9GAMM
MDDSCGSAILAGLPVGVLWRDMSTDAVNMNTAARELLRVHHGLGSRWYDDCARLQWRHDERLLPITLNPLLTALQGRTLRTTRYVLQREDTDVLLDITAYAQATIDGVPSIMTVVIAPVNLAVDGVSATSFDEVLAKVSARLIHVDADDIDEQIQAALAVLGEYSGVDRSYLFQFHNDHSCSNTHEWVRGGISSHKEDLQGLSERSLPWFFRHLREQRIVAIDDVSHLPPEAVLERNEFEREDIQAVLCVGLEYANELIGFIGFDRVHRTHHWLTHDIRRLKLVGEMIVHALQNLAYRQSLNQTQQNLLQANQELEQLAMLDGLTGVFNRRAFDQTLQKELQRAVRQGYPLSLLLVDIDHFKLYNDHHGHLAGDDALRQVAQVLSQEFQRSGELVARYGGEEFAIILPHNDEAEAIQSSNRALRRLRDIALPHEHPDVAGPLTMSIGLLVALPAIKTRRDDLISLADQALYKAKAAGRNQMKMTVLKGES